MLKKIVLIVSVFAFISKVSAQEIDPQKSAIIEQRIELIAESIGEENLDFLTLFDALANFYDHPINLNKTTKDELEDLMLLNEIQIAALFDHISRNGKLLSIYELQAISYWDLETIKLILPFVYVSDNFNTTHITFKKLINEGQHELFMRYTRILEQQEGYLPISDSLYNLKPNSRYLGSPDKLYARYRFRFGSSVSVGFTAEKDAGEEFFKGSQKNGFDFYSGHLFIRNQGKIKALALGDYQLSFGQGLTFSTGLAFGKNANTIGIKRNSNNVRPYTSAMENQFLRGAATTIDLKPIELTAFYSRLASDGNVITSDPSDTTTATDDNIVISSFQNTGLHSTPNELADRKQIVVSHYGGHAVFKTKKLNIGATAVYSDFGADLQKNLSYYNQFDLVGKNSFVTGIDYNFVHRNFNFFGEISRSKNGGMAGQFGMITAIDPRFSLALLYRNYQKNYQSLYANALAEASLPVNEKGLYIGIEARFNQEWTMNAYFDIFQSDWLRSSVSGPSKGFESLTQLNWRPSKKMDFYWRIKHRTKPYNTTLDIDDIDFLVDREQTNYRFQSTVKVSPSITLRNRIEGLSLYAKNEINEKGFLIYQDIIYKPLSSAFSFTARYAIFNTDSYNSRIYAFENEVLYFYSIPAYYYKGSRVYAILHYKFRKGLEIWLRASQFLYNNRTSIGSGLSTIQGNHKTEIKVQIRLSF